MRRRSPIKRGANMTDGIDVDAGPFGTAVQGVDPGERAESLPSLANTNCRQRRSQ